MRVVRGTFATNAGSAIYVGVGFIPKRVQLWNLTDQTQVYQKLDWADGFRTTSYGFQGRLVSLAEDVDATATNVSSDLASAGVTIYRGGDACNATLTYQIADPNMNKASKGATGSITKWTLDTAATGAGHFDQEAWITSPDPVGVGSEVVISGKRYVITTLTSNGEVAGEVVLNEVVQSGVCSYVGGIYTHIACPATLTMPPGFYLADVTYIAPSSEAVYFEAYDE